MPRGGFRFGAGRPARYVKADHCLRLDVRRLAAHGVLRDGEHGWTWRGAYDDAERGAILIRSSPGRIGLRYAIGETIISEPVRISTTVCNFGGSRPWLHCPRCDRRVAVLFLRAGRFICRHCGGVRYGSQSDDEAGRSWRRQRALEARLGPNWTRPKGMHHRTRARFLDAILACERVRDEILYAWAVRYMAVDTSPG